MTSTWNPRPDERASPRNRSAYFAGYSDGYHGAHFGAGQEAPQPDAYRHGFDDGLADKARLKLEDA